jgi:hypothetical protein
MGTLTPVAEPILRDVYRDPQDPLTYKTYALDQRELRRILHLPPLSSAARFVRILDGRVVRVRGRQRHRARRGSRARSSAASSGEDPPDDDHLDPLREAIESGDRSRIADELHRLADRDSGGDDDALVRCPRCGRPLLWVGDRLYCPTAGCGEQSR